MVILLVFSETFGDFIEKSKLLEAQVTFLTPYPGTPLYKRLKSEGRLLKDKYWDRCTMFDINFRPKNMSIEELEKGLLWLFKKIYNEKEYLKRKRHYMDIVKSYPEEGNDEQIRAGDYRYYS